MINTAITFADDSNPSNNAFKLRLELYTSLDALVISHLLDRIELYTTSSGIKLMKGGRQVYVGSGQKMRILTDFTGSSGPASMLTTGLEAENWLNISKLGPFGPITL
jgi:hypothetical protein